jgi:hypothetical protein
MVQSNNNRNVNNRITGFQSITGPSQRRQTIPLTPKAAAAARVAVANQQYFNDGMSPNPGMNNYGFSSNKSAIKTGSALATVYKAASMVKDFNDRLPPEHRITMGKAGKAASSAIRKVGDVAGNAFKGGPMKSGSPSIMNASYGLSKAPNPRPVNLNSGIVPNTYANDYMLATTNSCSPLHMHCVKLEFPTSVNNTLSKYLTQTIMFDIQTRAQANVGFDVDITSKLSQTNLVAAFQAALSALQIYYYYASILSYESDPRNKNEGMINLRQSLSAQYISDLVQLGRRLEDTPVPPRIVEWVRYMSMNFLSGDSQGSAILKTTFDSTVMDTFTSPSPIAVALANLNSVSNINVFTLLRRAIPQWRVGKLYDVPPTPVFDKNFLTIWANMPSNHYSAGVFVYGSNVTSTSDVVQYNSYHNRLDGMAFAMGGTFDTVSITNRPGFTVPFCTTTKFSKRSFYSVAGAAGTWENVVGNHFLSMSRAESYQTETVGGTPITPHLPGAEKCQGVSSQALNQTAQNVLDFLFDINSIPVKGTISHFSVSGMNNIVKFK